MKIPKKGYLVAFGLGAAVAATAAGLVRKQKSPVTRSVEAALIGDAGPKSASGDGTQIVAATPIFRNSIFDGTGKAFAQPDYGLKVAVATGLPVTDKEGQLILGSALAAITPLSEPESFLLDIPPSGAVLTIRPTDGAPDYHLAVFWAEGKDCIAESCERWSDQVFWMSGRFSRMEPEFASKLARCFSGKSIPDWQGFYDRFHSK
jgi:hypothetical protein